MVENLDLLFDGSYSPFAGIHSMPAQISFHELGGEMKIGDLKITTQVVDHGDASQESKSAATYAYRFATQKTSVTIVTDHEGRTSLANQKVVEFAANSDILVHDAQYTEEEYELHTGWGHSSFTQALDNGLATKSRLCLLTHHDPKRMDSELQEHVKRLFMMPKYKDLSFEFSRENEDYICEKSEETDKAAS